MMKLILDKIAYEKVEVLLPEICPNIDFELETIDENLEKLGLCKSAPCVVRFKLNESDTLLDIEVDAFNVVNGENSIEYRKYLKYGCLYDIFYNAEKVKAE